MARLDLYDILEGRDEWADLRDKYGSGIDVLNGCLEIFEMFIKVRINNGEYSKLYDRFQMLLEDYDEKTADSYRTRLKSLEENYRDVSSAEVRNLRKKMSHGSGIQYHSMRAQSRGSIIVGESESGG